MPKANYKVSISCCTHPPANPDVFSFPPISFKPIHGRVNTDRNDEVRCSLDYEMFILSHIPGARLVAVFAVDAGHGLVRNNIYERGNMKTTKARETYKALTYDVGVFDVFQVQQ